MPEAENRPYSDYTEYIRDISIHEIQHLVIREGSEMEIGMHWHLDITNEPASTASFSIV